MHDTIFALSTSRLLYTKSYQRPVCIAHAASATPSLRAPQMYFNYDFIKKVTLNAVASFPKGLTQPTEDKINDWLY